jgi:iron complex outermembrane recepter protein
MKTLLSALVGAALAAACLTAGAEEFAKEKPIQLDIESGTLTDALNAWAQQTGFNLISHTNGVTDQLSAPRVQGVLTARQALAQLLAGTSLTYQRIDERTVKVSTPQQEPAAGDKAGAFASPEPPSLRLSYLSDGPQAGEPRSRPERQTAAEVGGGRDAGRRNVELFEEVLVTGTRLKNAGETSAPVAVFNRSKLDELGVATVGEVLRYLPQQPYSRWIGSEAGGAQYAEMRGLGVDTTLVLLNGRRTLPSAANVSRNAFDLNSIPLAAIERIEVLSDSASAIYGADAMGGVINVIMKDDIPRPTVELSYGAADGGGDERRGSLSAGFYGERAHGSVVLDYFERDLLLGERRERWRNQDFRRFGADDLRATQSAPGNVMSLTGDNLPGLNAPFAAVPRGASGQLTPADFAPTAGQQNKESLERYASIVPEAQRLSFVALGSIEATPQLDVFGEFLYADREARSQTFPTTLFSAFAPAENPFNPFGEPVLVDYLFSTPQQTLVESELYRGLAGVRGARGVWDWEIFALTSQEDSTSTLANGLDFSLIDAALMETDPSRALNVFHDGPAGSPALLSSLVAAPTVNEYSSEGAQGSAVVRGELGALPAGSLDVVFGAEWRKEEILFRDFVDVSQDRTVRAAFSELRVPLVSSEMNVGGVNELFMTAAVRFDDYSDFGDTVNPQYGLVWRPTADLTFRGTYGSSFRPPSLFELYAPQTVVPGFALDPLRDNEIATPDFVTGGNPELDPIEARSLTTGVVFTPAAVEGLRLWASYWRVELEDRVITFAPELVLGSEARYPDRVTRAQPTPADVAAGLPGVLTSIDISRINFGTLETSGVDFAVSYELDTRIGRLAPSISATWVEKYEAVDVPDTPAVNRVNVASGLGTIARWKAVGSLSWAWRALTATLTANYIPAYADTSALTLAKTGREIPSQTLVDVQASVDLGAFDPSSGAWLKGLRVTAGLVNATDEEPNYSDVAYVAGYDPSIGDLRQRFGYVRLTKDF